MQFHTRHVRIVHADPVVGAGLQALLARHGEWQVTLEASMPDTGPKACVLVADHAAGIALARRHGDRIPVLVVTPLGKEWDIHMALSNGVRGYVLQPCAADEPVQAVRRLLRGERHLSAALAARVADSVRRTALTARQTDVLKLLGEGCCNKQIARRLGIGVGTVKTHVKGLMARLDATARTHAVVVAAQRGLITPGGQGLAGVAAG